MIVGQGIDHRVGNGFQLRLWHIMDDDLVGLIVDDERVGRRVRVAIAGNVGMGRLQSDLDGYRGSPKGSNAYKNHLLRDR